MMRYILFFLLVLIRISHAQSHKTVLSIKGEDFYINNEITLKGKIYNGIRLEGLLPNSRMVQGIFDDLNPDTRSNWKYADTGEWDPERNTTEFVAAMPLWRDTGLLAITLNLQGGNPYGYSTGKQTWKNTAFKPDGSLDPAYMNRLARILDQADKLGMIVILGYFYFGQDQHVRDEKAVKKAVRKATEWILDKGYQHVIVEINNECDINRTIKNGLGDGYDHAILGPTRVHELINEAKSFHRKSRRLLVSTSFTGGSIPTNNVLSASDFVLVHGNSVENPEKITNLVKAIRAISSYKNNPIVFNEDDHFSFDQPVNNFLAATEQHASWGYFDYRMKNEAFQDGYQSMPADWGVTSKRKSGFFNLLKKMTH